MGAILGSLQREQGVVAGRLSGGRFRSHNLGKAWGRGLGLSELSFGRGLVSQAQGR